MFATILTKIFKQEIKQRICNHTYCYRSRKCTKCGKYCDGPEPTYTPHIIINDKPVPAIEIDGRLVEK